MSELQPLLSGAGEWPPSSREKLARKLDSANFHRIVISLITIDASCVLAELIYTFLTPSCTPVGHDSPAWLEALQSVSLVITTLFLIEIPLAVWAFGLQFYIPFGPIPHAALHFFDAAIIVITFVLEVVLKGRERELAGLLVVLRLWRLVKLVGGIAVGAGELGEEDAKALAETRQELQHTQAELAAAKEQVERLQAKLAEMGANGEERVS